MKLLLRWKLIGLKPTLTRTRIENSLGMFYFTNKRTLVAALLFALLFVCAFTSAAGQNTFLKLDQAIFDAIYVEKNFRSTGHKLMGNITHLGHSYTILGFSLLNIAYGIEKKRQTGRLISSAFLSSGLITYTTKKLINRHRPLDIYGTDTPALPSGHTSNAFTLATILGKQHPKLRIPFYIGAGVIGISRVYLGRYYLSDVLAGAAIGTGAGLLTWHYRPTSLKWEF